MNNRTRLCLMVLVVALVANLFTVGAFAEATSGSCGANLTWTVNTETGELTISGTGAMNDYSSTTAPWSAYKDVITEVTVGEGVTSLGAKGSLPFNGFTKNFTVSLPSTLTTIDSQMKGNTKLVAVTFPDRGALKNIYDWSFSGCTALTYIKLPETEGTDIWNGAFNNCKALTEIVLPASVKTVGKANGSAFSGSCAPAKITFLGMSTSILPADASGIPASATIHGLAGSTANIYADDYDRTFVEVKADQIAEGTIGENITWTLSSDGVLTISGTGAMSSAWNVAEYNDKVTKVVVEEGVTALPTKAFNSLTNGFTAFLPGTLENMDTAFNSSKVTAVTFAEEGCLSHIYSWCFSGCSELESIVLPNNAETKIQNGAFNNCRKLTSVTLGDKTASILGQAFNNCSALTEIVIPASVTSLGDATNGTAFSGCGNLTKVTLLGADTVITGTFPASNVTLIGYIGSTAEDWSKANSASATFSPIVTDVTMDTDTTVFELTATYTPNAEKAGQYLPVATLTRTGADGTVAIDLLYVEGATCALYVKSTEGAYLPLLDGEDSVTLSDVAAEIAVIYNNEEGTVRYYVNGVIPSVNSAETLAAFLPVHNSSFHTVTAVKDELAVRGDVMVGEVFDINASGTADFVGFQVDTDTSKSIRLLAGIDMLYYGNVGFEIELYSEDSLVGTVSKSVNTVFNTIMANDEPISAASKGYRYLTAVQITDIYPGDYSGDNLYFVVKPFTQVGKEVLYGTAAKILISYDEETQKNVYEIANEDGY